MPPRLYHVTTACFSRRARMQSSSRVCPSAACGEEASILMEGVTPKAGGEQNEKLQTHPAECQGQEEGPASRGVANAYWKRRCYQR